MSEASISLATAAHMLQAKRSLTCQRGNADVPLFFLFFFVQQFNSFKVHD